MKKLCRECRTTHNIEAKYCDACGFQFWDEPIREMQRWQTAAPRHYGTAIAAGLAVAVARYLILG
ncbi:MAG: hypothetical protein ABI824_02285 [Acidobacteriota bacterium]